jgi:Stage II sporulation protein E (SpoIIE)
VGAAGRQRHPPPLAVISDRVTFLHTEPGPLLGWRGPITRRALGTRLDAGSTLVLFTDRLIERRTEPIGAGLERLRAAAELTVEEPIALVCKLLIEHVVPDRNDDLATLVLRLT